MKAWHRILGIVVIGAALLSAGGYSSWAYDPFGDYKDVSLEKLQGNPTAYKNTKVQFPAILDKVENLWAHFYTPFTADDFMAFSVWDASK
ncbi:MAG: hypothetical protein RDV41_15870, partial [Planctomycetota bacterium]|nr:hypothetical protein [Planctomycetota bacterium]